MIGINREERVILASLLVLFIGFFTGMYYRRVDHILRTSWMIVYILALLWLPTRYPLPKGKAGTVLSPLYDRKILAFTSIFLAIHASLVNVPFTDIDLFNVAFRDVDMISHFLGGLTAWLMLTKLLNGLMDDSKKAVKYSFVILLLIGVSWEFAEWIGSHFTEGILQETVANKIRDIVMEQLGALLGLWMVRKKGYPFRLDD